MKQGKGAPGFTLLELIVTFTILSLVVVMILGALRLGSASWERGEERVEKVQKKRIVFELLSQQMKSSFPYRIKSQKAEADFLAFLGERTSLRFVSAFSIRARKQEGLVFVIYKVEEERTSGKTLKVYEKRVLNKNFLEETPDEEQFFTLADGLSDLNFEYFDEGESGDASGEWVESWDTQGEEGVARSGEDHRHVEREEGGVRDSPSCRGYPASPCLRRSGKTAVFSVDKADAEVDALRVPYRGNEKDETRP